MKARYNYRIYPKPNQIQPLAQAFGCARVVWNDALWLYKKASIEGQPMPKDVDKLVITQAKKTPERAWLKEVSNIVLQQSFRDLLSAWNNYFSSRSGKRKGFPVGRPKFKKKQSRQAIRFRKGGFKVASNSVFLAKIGHVPMVVSRPLPSEPSSVTIIFDCAGRYFASFVVEIPLAIVPEADNSIGIDLGLTHFAILSNGEKVENPRLHKKMLRRIKKANRQLSRAKKESRRRKRRKLKLAKLHAKVKDQRTDFLHKLTTRLVRENQALGVEDLNVSGLVKNHPPAEGIPPIRGDVRGVADAGWAKFKTMLAAKCDKYGRHLTIVDRWYPSSQLCSNCGESGGRKELDVREWECLYCNSVHDRDINAAINLRDAGGLSESKNGRGSKCKTTVVAVCDEPSTTPRQLTLF